MRKMQSRILRGGPTIKAGIKAFKSRVITITQSSLGSGDHKLFAAARSPINRMRAVGIINMMPAIAAVP